MEKNLDNILLGFINFREINKQKDQRIIIVNNNKKSLWNNNELSDRLDSCMVDAFKKNPYTQSLSSF